MAMLSAAVAHGGTNVEYCRGVLDTARAQALNYGIDWPALVGGMRQALHDRPDLLDAVCGVLENGQ